MTGRARRAQRSRGAGPSLHGAISAVTTSELVQLSLHLLERRFSTPAAVGILPRDGETQVRLAGHLATQHSAVTCGATAILLMNAEYDQALARWLTGGRIPPRLPPEIAALRESELREPAVGRRFALAQDSTHRLLTRRAVGRIGWPRALGTPPWMAARIARVPGVSYSHRAVDDRRPAVIDRVLTMMLAATSAGIPVPFYSGGNLAHRPSSAVPRHVLLALPTSGEQLRIFNPADARIHLVPADALRARTAPLAALGNWTSLAWTLIPLPHPRADG